MEISAMTELEREISELEVMPKNGFRSWPLWVRALVVFGLVSAIFANIALVLAGVAIKELASQTECTNTNLGIRQLPSNLDAAANRNFAAAIVSAFDPRTGTPDQRGKTLMLEAKAWKWQLAEDQKMKDANPLGKC